MPSKIDLDVVLLKIFELTKALDAMPMSKHEGCWEHRIDDQYTLVCNGHKEPLEWGCQTVQPYHFYVEYSGWPFAVFNPATGGQIGDGSMANADAFIAAMEAATERAQDATGPERTP